MLRAMKIDPSLRDLLLDEGPKGITSPIPRDSRTPQAAPISLSI
jgi:hypothetical protein